MIIVKKLKQKKKDKTSNFTAFLTTLIILLLVVGELLANYPLPSFVICALIYFIYKKHKKQKEIRRQQLLLYNSTIQKKVVGKMRYYLNKVLQLEKHPLSKSERIQKKRLKESFYELYNQMNTKYVYVIEESSNGYVKIGKADDPMKRAVNGLGAKSPYAIQVLHLIPTHVPLDVEKWFHTAYNQERLNGEWFCLSDAQKTKIKTGDYSLDLLELLNTRPLMNQPNP